MISLVLLSILDPGQMKSKPGICKIVRLLTFSASLSASRSPPGSSQSPEVEKLGPKSNYTPQTGGEVSEMRSAEVIFLV